MSTTEQLKDLTEQKYRYGFVTEIEEDRVPKGLSEEVVRTISAKKGEPQFLLGRATWSDCTGAIYPSSLEGSGGMRRSSCA